MPFALVSADSITGRANALPPPFVCSLSNCSLDAVRVHLAGELDIATTPQLEQTLRESQLHAQLAVLDMRELAFMATSGVHAIVNASIRAREAGRRLVVLRGPPNVDRVFAATGRSGDVELAEDDLAS